VVHLQHWQVDTSPAAAVSLAT